MSTLVPWNALLDMKHADTVSNSGTANISRLIKLSESCRKICV